MIRDADTDIRQAGEGDIAVIRTIVRAAYAKWVAVIGREPLPMTADYAEAVRAHRIDLLQRGTNVVGLIETMLSEDHLWIENVAVRPEFQGRGYGRLLLRHADELAASNSRKEVRLLTNAAFETNVRFYERNGYTVTRSDPFMGGTTLCLSKTIAN